MRMLFLDNRFLAIFWYVPGYNYNEDRIDLIYPSGKFTFLCVTFKLSGTLHVCICVWAHGDTNTWVGFISLYLVGGHCLYLILSSCAMSNKIKSLHHFSNLPLPLIIRQGILSHWIVIWKWSGKVQTVVIHTSYLWIICQSTSTN